MRKVLAITPLVVVLVAGAAVTSQADRGGGGGGDGGQRVHQVTATESDQFTPFALTIRAGDSVRWVNTDADRHSVVSDDAYNTPGKKGINDILAANGGTDTLRFQRPGTFVYYCRFHAALNANNQPVAPGPDGGFQDPATGNFGTPMSGVVTVLPRNDD